MRQTRDMDRVEVAPTGTAGLGAARMPVVSVRGEATLDADPEIAQLSAEAAGRSRDRSAALAALARAQRDLADALAPFAGAIERTEQGQIAVYPIFAPDRPEVADLWVASLRLSVTIADLPATADVAGALGAVGGVAVSGPAWMVRATSDAHRRCRAAAIDDALRRAADYADAVGARVERLLEIADLGLSGSGGAPRAMAMFARAAAEPAVLDLAPQPQTIHAGVELRVAISEPGRELIPPR